MSQGRGNLAPRLGAGDKQPPAGNEALEPQQGFEWIPAPLERETAEVLGQLPGVTSPMKVQA